MKAKRIMIKSLFDNTTFFNKENCDFRIYESKNQGFTDMVLIVNEELNVTALQISSSSRLSLDFSGYIHKHDDGLINAVRVGVYVFF